MNNLPDLPSPYFWAKDNVLALLLKAKKTKWCRKHGSESEALGIVRRKKTGELALSIWKLNEEGTGDWQELPAPCATLEEAANLLWTLCQLGEIDHSFPEESDETK